MPSASPRCQHCLAALEIKQTCLNVYWYCPACNRRHAIEDFPEFIDEALEERLANVRCNRI